LPITDGGAREVNARSSAASCSVTASNIGSIRRFEALKRGPHEKLTDLLPRNHRSRSAVVHSAPYAPNSF
jgi:hypothetical protein